MITRQSVIKLRDLNTANFSNLTDTKPQLAFVFGPIACFENKDFIANLQKNSPETKWVGCSTAGEVSGKGVTDDTIVLTSLKLENPSSKIRIEMVPTGAAEASQKAGEELGKKLAAPDLKSVIIISPGINVNGTMLVQGINKTVGPKVVVTGGLAGDGGKFQNTLTLSPSGVKNDQLIGIGIYGDTLSLKHGCMGGWDPFGKVRKVTKSVNNVVHELDGKPALEVYKEYLGDHAKDLPGSGLMFPFSMMDNEKSENGLIRTILAVDDAKGTMTFAGDVAQGSTVRLMQANTKGLVGGAKNAAEKAAVQANKNKDTFAMIVSCVGRKLVMGPNVDEEIEAISDIFGPKCTLAGFYSYGEISPFLSDVGCQLHNQTMTISYLSEA